MWKLCKRCQGSHRCTSQFFTHATKTIAHHQWDESLPLSVSLCINEPCYRQWSAVTSLPHWASPHPDYWPRGSDLWTGMKLSERKSLGVHACECACRCSAHACVAYFTLPYIWTFTRTYFQKDIWNLSNSLK